MIKCRTYSVLRSGNDPETWVGKLRLRERLQSIYELLGKHGVRPSQMEEARWRSNRQDPVTAEAR